jgi:3'-phosphoadenosine 5'-phosphosulfate sulfotransferase (PAPS reductase)/FAD synthetase|tara:strand:- start:221 stop:1018 length:798 start_codon:yes stop_codon:yes gene_type:complete
MSQMKFEFAQRTFQHIPTDSEIIVPVSGGKDSTATFILALQHFEKDKIIPIHCNTGWDHPKTYEYLDYMQEKSGIEIQHTKYEEAETMPDLIRRMKMFPTRNTRFCTSRYKETATTRWYKKNGFWESRKGQVWLGIRSDESHQRRKKYGSIDSTDIHNYLDVFSWLPKSMGKNLELRFPVIDWDTQDCFDHIKDYGWKHNPLYDEGASRVGCYPCLLSNKKKQREEFNTEFGRTQLKFIKDLEKELGIKYEMYDDDQGSCEVCNI